MHVEEKQLKDFITDSGLISRTDIDEAENLAKVSKKSIGDVLISSGKFSEDDLRRMQAYILGIPFVNLKGQKLDTAVLSLIPEPIARKHNIVAFKKNDDALEVAMLYTDDLQAINSVKKKVGVKILPRLTDTESMRGALLQYQKNLKDEFGDLIQEDSVNIKAVTDTL